MFLKAVVFGLQVLLIKTILGQCIGNIGSSYGIGNYEGLDGNSYGLLNSCGRANVQLCRPQLINPDYGIVGASYGGSFNVETSSPFAPGSISLQSENQIQGPLSVYGTLPFLSAVAFEGSLPTLGSGAVTYQCGDGKVAILEEKNAASGYEGYNPFVSGCGLSRSGLKGICNCV